MNQDILFEILILLDFINVKALCLSNKDIYQSCNNKYFWKKYFNHLPIYNNPSSTNEWLSEYQKIYKSYETASNLLNTVSYYESIRLFLKTNSSQSHDLRDTVIIKLNELLGECTNVPGEVEYGGRNNDFYGYGDFIEINYNEFNDKTYSIRINLNIIKTKECLWTDFSYDTILQILTFLIYHYDFNFIYYRNHYTDYELRLRMI